MVLYFIEAVLRVKERYQSDLLITFIILILMSSYCLTQAVTPGLDNTKHAQLRRVVLEAKFSHDSSLQVHVFSSEVLTLA